MYKSFKGTNWIQNTLLVSFVIGFKIIFGFILTFWVLSSRPLLRFLWSSLRFSLYWILFWVLRSLPVMFISVSIPLWSFQHDSKFWWTNRDLWPLAILIGLLALWLGVCTPLTLFGSYLGFKKPVRLSFCAYSCTQSHFLCHIMLGRWLFASN